MASITSELPPASPVVSLADDQLRKRLSGSSSITVDQNGVCVSSYLIDHFSRPRTRNLTSSQQSDNEHEEDAEDMFEDARDAASLRSRPLTETTVAVEPKASHADVDVSPEGGNNKLHDSGEDTHDDKPDSGKEGEENTAAEVSLNPDGAESSYISERGAADSSVHSTSEVSNMDNVNLDDDAVPPSHSADGQAADVAGATDGTVPAEEKPAEQPPAEPKPPPKPTKTLSLGSFTSALPSLPWSMSSSQAPTPAPAPDAAAADSPSVSSVSNVPAAAPTPAPALPPPTVATPPARKISSPFAWLSRASTIKEPPPPPPAPRRNTTSSMATMRSNPELMLGRLTDDKDSDSTHNFNPVRNSLRDRFQQLRQQSEVAEVTSPTDDNIPAVARPAMRSVSSPLGLVSPPNEEDRDQGSYSKAPLSPVPPSPNPSLAPGTAVGVESGPSALSEGNVDWDLWQSVVYEGPAAVARSSAEELNRAIATGIPNAIRGVIWQVLAQSKNEDLESVYRDLSTRGTDKAKERKTHSTTASTASNGQLSIQSDTQAAASSVSSVTSEGGGANSTPAPPEKLSEAVLKAQAAADAERKRKEKEDVANIQKLEKTIRRDMGTRTSYSKYAAAEGLQDGLFGLCKAYALFDEEVSYAQGMNFLIMPLLFNMPEEEAFCLLVRLMNHYGLRELFINDMPGLHMRLYQFERLLEDFEPAVYCHLHRRHISPHLYATQWFLTLFAYRFPLQLVLRIYDLILSEGLSAILRFGLVLMHKNAATLLAMHDMQQLTTFLKDKVFDVYIDKAPSAGSLLENGFFGSSSSSLDKEVYHADQMVRDACEIRITPQMLKSYTAEWEEKTRSDREREAELENLRSANANYAHRLRKLEERIEAADLEQAQLATDLVHTKVENQELADDNEGLRGQVRELRNVIEKQPAEIESAWQAERDDMAKRHESVHELNQKLEKEMVELEEELVQTKMKLAELNSQHESLNRKWADLKRQFA
jgi:predicted  nucleic acid-binding Zn-ribbon protein